ncbi:lipocalin family protein [Cellulophaga sp. Hel_I_12]|uniref:lipocalin family protein n=1 Tax=Cellulophaga sp. Hel_I_12 TaxID=1249972 RepID=UPI00064811ED|nr:lipocalin family protein [Cellulophaga sp. Hel_I_12]
MKRIILAAMVCATLSLSCSEDKNEDAMIASNLVGVWEFSELDTANATGNVNLINDILMNLVASGCDILSYDFKSDQTVTASYRDFTETGRDVNLGGTGLLIECPSNVIMTSGVWELNGDQLSFIDTSGSIETVTIEIDGNTLTIPGEVLDEDNLAGTKAIFIKQ